MSSCTSEIPLLKRLQLLAVLCLGLTSVAYGRTITVERDGSGDFSTLQPALDACAAGDTVLIGPGTFEEMNNFYLPGNGGWVDIAGYVQVDKITIIGSGVDNTIIGQEVFTPVGEGPKGFVFLNPGTIEIQNLAIRNTFNGIFLVDSVPIIRNCQFSGNYIGIIWLSSGSGGGVFDSTFIGTDPINSRGLSILGNGRDMVISNCIFDASRPEIQSVNNLTMNGCEIFGSKLGMQVSFGATVMVSNCYFHSIAAC